LQNPLAQLKSKDDEGKRKRKTKTKTERERERLEVVDASSLLGRVRTHPLRSR